LVMHKEAMLPPICMQSGEPATHWRKFRLLWCYPIDWATRSLYLNLPLCESASQSFAWRRRVSWLVLLIPLLISFELALFVRNWPDWLLPAVALCDALGVFACAIIQATFSKPVAFVRVRDKYLWIKGFDSRFLARLPEWQFSD
jgi:hypothetical protein